MSSDLPSPVLRHLFKVIIKDARASAESKGTWHCMRLQRVCRKWMEEFLAVYYTNSAPRFSRDEGSGQVGDLCMPLAVPYIVAMQLWDIPDSFLSNDLHHFSATLVFLDLRLLDLPSPEGLRSLRCCVHLERLAIVCKPDLPGSLHAILDTLRFLPDLEHLSLEHFEASRGMLKKTASIPYTVPPSLNLLHLNDITGPGREELLTRAFDPALVFSLTTLSLAGLGNSLTHKLVSAFHTSLVDFSVELDVSDLLVSLLPDDPFPSLRHFRLTFTPILPPLHAVRELNNLSVAHILNLAAFPALTPGGVRRLALESAEFVAPDDWWSDYLVERTLHRFQHGGPYELAFEEALAGGYAENGLLDRYKREGKSDRYLLAMLLGNEFHWAFGDGTKVSVSTCFWRGLEFFPVDEVLEKGDKLRAAAKEKAREQQKA
ncbi:hypothetical protein JCM8097_007900 [Rhodosporidiobolus ruineniae]